MSNHRGVVLAIVTLVACPVVLVSAQEPQSEQAAQKDHAPQKDQALQKDEASQRDVERMRVPEAGDYLIGPEDVLDIAVWNNTSISRSIPVRPDGRISLPLLNDIQAAGVTPMQLRDVLIKKLTDYMPNPEVSVIVREVHSFKVSVIGEVKTTGRYELKSRATVLDLLAQAGGFSPFASPARIVILRPDSGNIKRIPFNYNKVVAADIRQDNFFLQAGDVVVVP